jgi:hypothetical protein
MRPSWTDSSPTDDGLVAPSNDEPLIYRTEVLAIIGALADLVVDVGDIRDALVEGDEGEGTEGAE